jgi:hypothetical protein
VGGLSILGLLFLVGLEQLLELLGLFVELVVFGGEEGEALLLEFFEFVLEEFFCGGVLGLGGFG